MTDVTGTPESGIRLKYDHRASNQLQTLGTVTTAVMATDWSDEE